jgi:hypothetical protein
MQSNNQFHHIENLSQVLKPFQQDKGRKRESIKNAQNGKV